MTRLLSALALGAAMAGAPQARVYGYGNTQRAIAFSRKHARDKGNSIAEMNRHTRQPHKHLREIARRTTKPGTPERRAAMEAARHG